MPTSHHWTWFKWIKLILILLLVPPIAFTSDEVDNSVQNDARPKRSENETSSEPMEEGHIGPGHTQAEHELSEEEMEGKGAITNGDTDDNEEPESEETPRFPDGVKEATTDRPEHGQGDGQGPTEQKSESIDETGSRRKSKKKKGKGKGRGKGKGKGRKNKGKNHEGHGHRRRVPRGRESNLF